MYKVEQTRLMIKNCHNLNAPPITDLPDGLVIPVDGAELLLVRPRQHLLVEDLRLLVLALLHVRTGQVVLGLGHIRIVLAQLRLVDLQRPLVVHLDLLVFALRGRRLIRFMLNFDWEGLVPVLI